MADRRQLNLQFTANDTANETNSIVPIMGHTPGLVPAAQTIPQKTQAPARSAGRDRMVVRTEEVRIAPNAMSATPAATGVSLILIEQFPVQAGTVDSTAALSTPQRHDPSATLALPANASKPSAPKAATTTCRI